MSRKFYVLGATGKLGAEFQKQITARGDECDTVRFDLSKRDQRNHTDFGKISVHDYIRLIKPDVVINCAAFNGMEACGLDPDNAFIINGAAPAMLSDACYKAGSTFIHFSTDYVFDGLKNTLESPLINDWTAPYPESVYARSKLLGEVGVSQSVWTTNTRAMVFRVSSLYNESFAGPLDPLRQFQAHIANPNEKRALPRINVFSQMFTPTSVKTVARAVLCALDNPHSGIYNLVTSGVVSRDEFARYIINRAEGTEMVLAMNHIQLPIKRPVNVCLSNSLFERTFGFKLPTWKEDIDAHIAEGSFHAHRHSKVV